MSYGYHHCYMTFLKRKQEPRNRGVASIIKRVQVMVVERQGSRKMEGTRYRALIDCETRLGWKRLQIKRELRAHENRHDSSHQALGHNKATAC